MAADAGSGDGHGAENNSCEGSWDLLLTNGEIYTGDPANLNVSSVAIRNGRFAAVGNSGVKTGPCTEVIDLMKKRVVPGLIDSHAHWVRDGVKPGHDVREIETAFTKADAIKILAKKAADLGDLPTGQVPTSDDFITALGGWDMRQFVDGPITKADLDSIPTNRPIYLHPFLFFSGITNEIGKTWIEGKDLGVNGDGVVPGGPPGLGNSTLVFEAMRNEQTYEDRLRGTRELSEHSASVGLTTVNDHAGVTAGPLTKSFVGFPDRSYDPIVELARSDQLVTRIRANFYMRDADEDLANLNAHINVAWRDFGDGMLRVNGFGEEVVSRPGNFVPANYVAALEKILDAGWSLHQNVPGISKNKNELTDVLEAWEKVASTRNANVLAQSHWSLEHLYMFDGDQAILDRISNLGVGVALQSVAYLLTPAQPQPLPRYRDFVDAGITVGGGSNAQGVAPLSPWVNMYFMTTGKNVAGTQIDPLGDTDVDQRLTREEALHIYTLGSAWFSREENDLGSIEIGKKADLTVLDRDYFKVSDDDIRKIRSILTIVDGRVVHKADPFKGH